MRLGASLLIKNLPRRAQKYVRIGVIVPCFLVAVRSAKTTSHVHDPIRD